MRPKMKMTRIMITQTHLQNAQILQIIKIIHFTFCVLDFGGRDKTARS